MKNAKTINTTDTYRDVSTEFKGVSVLFRHYFESGAVHIRVDDNFARANGFNLMEDIYRIDPAMRAVEWIDAKMFGAGMIAAVIGPAPTKQQTHIN